MVHSSVDPSSVSISVFDLDAEAFEVGRSRAARLGIDDRISFQRADARQIIDHLNCSNVQIVELIGLLPYLDDQQSLELLRALREVLAPMGSIVVDGLVDRFGHRPFLKRVFDWSLIERSEADVHRLLQQAGFEPTQSMTAPTGIFPVVVAAKGGTRAESQQSAA